MNISVTSGILMIILTAFMWGSWFQFVRRIGKWPVPAFILWLYFFALLIVWSAIGLLKDIMIPDGIAVELAKAKPLAALIFVCGMIFAIGMQVQMIVVSKVGLIFSASVTSVTSILMGTVVSSILAGLPSGVSPYMIALATATLITASLTCQYAKKKRDRDTNPSLENAKKQEKTNNKYILVMLLSMLIFSPAYTVAASLGIRTALNPKGIPSLLMMGILSLGAFAGTLIFSGIQLTLNKQWKELLAPTDRKCFFYAAISGLCHFGGNIIHALAAPVLSVAIAWPMGNTYHIWSYIWGLIMGEFKGAKKSTYAILFTGMLLFGAAILILARTLYA